jgi:hypothetical protein
VHQGIGGGKSGAQSLLGDLLERKTAAADKEDTLLGPFYEDVYKDLEKVLALLHNTDWTNNSSLLASHISTLCSNLGYRVWPEKVFGPRTSWVSGTFLLSLNAFRGAGGAARPGMSSSGMDMVCRLQHVLRCCVCLTSSSCPFAAGDVPCSRNLAAA